MKTAIIRISDLEFLGIYEGAKNLEQFEGEKGDANLTEHITLDPYPDWPFTKASKDSNGSITIAMDIIKCRKHRHEHIKKRLAQKITFLNKAVIELFLGIRTDTAAVKAYYEAIEAMKQKYAYDSKKPMPSIDGLDVDESFPTLP